MIAKKSIRSAIIGLMAVALLWSMCALVNAETEKERPHICVKGILYDNNVPLALVNQVVVRVGDMTAGAKVIQISSSSVEFEYNGEIFQEQVGNCKEKIAPLLEGVVAGTEKAQGSLHKKQKAAVLYDNIRDRASQLKLSVKEEELFARAMTLMVAFMGIIVLVLVVIHVYIAIALQIIARKTAIENGWLAWIPVANLYLCCRIADKPGWWLLLFFVPFVNIIIGILVCREIARARNKPSWLGILLALVPGINLIVLGYLAFSKDAVIEEKKTVPTPTTPPPPKKSTGLTL